MASIAWHAGTINKLKQKHAMFDSLKIQVYPEVNGVVTMNGEPVEGALVKFVYNYNDKDKVIETTTDKSGKFHFSEKYERTLRMVFGLETAIHQNITIIYNYATYVAWRTIKYAHGEDTALSNKLTSLNCELTNEEKRQLIDPTSPIKDGIYSLARWDNQ